MAQTYKMNHNPQGTIYSLLTVESDGQMTMTFHGTDREICHEANVTEDGRITTGGSLFPGLESGRWQSATQMRNEKLVIDKVALTSVKEMRNENEEMRNEVADIQGTVPAVGSEAESERTTERLSPMCAEPAVPAESALRGQSPCNPPSATHTGDSPREPRPRRQRKPRKPRVERQSSAISHQPSDIDRHHPSDISHRPSSTLKAVGMVAAATVALFVIYETGLLIPLGLIGLATGGILK